MADVTSRAGRRSGQYWEVAMNTPQALCSPRGSVRDYYCLASRSDRRIRVPKGAKKRPSLLRQGVPTVKALQVDSYSRKKPRRGFILLALGKGRTRLSGCGRADGGGTSAGGRGSTGLELLALLKRFARCAAFAAAVSLGLIAMPAWSREGDLDQRFGDHGRLSRMPGLFGPAWSLVTLDDGSTLLAGGGLINICPDEDPYCYDWGPVGYQARSFIAGISVSGSIDPDFDAFQSSKLQIRDFAWQADGKLIVVGRRVSESSLDGPLVVRRINVDGSHDITFG